MAFKRRPRAARGAVPSRRSTYFAFQGLFMTVLVLMFAYERGSRLQPGRLGFLAAMTLASLAALQAAPAPELESSWFQTSFFLADAALASLTLRWTQPQSDFYLLYFLIIFGTALTRDLAKSLLAALVTSLLYLASAWSPAVGLPKDTGFWLRFLMLWTSTPLLAILSRDTEQARLEQERKYQERLIQFERLAALGQLAGEVAHRIKAPLTTILVDAEVLSHRLARSPEHLRELSEIQEEVGRCKLILKNLLDLGRIEEMDFVELDLRRPVERALKAVEPQLRGRGPKLDVSGLDAPMPARGDESLLQEALTAVLQNAVEATRSRGGAIRLSARRAVSRGRWLRGGPARWELVVEDDGEGIARKDLERVFAPFFTTKGEEGDGLGLSAALRILQKHGGTIEAQSEGKGRGARFVLSLPAA